MPVVLSIIIGASALLNANTISPADIDYTADYTVAAELLTQEQFEVALRDRPLVRGGAAVIRGAARAGAAVIRGSAKVVRGVLVVGGKVIKGIGRAITREAYTVSVTTRDGKVMTFVRYGQLPQTLVARMWCNARVDGELDVWGYSTYDASTQFRTRVPIGDVVNITATRATVVFIY